MKKRWEEKTPEERQPEARLGFEGGEGWIASDSEERTDGISPDLIDDPLATLVKLKGKVAERAWGSRRS